MFISQQRGAKDKLGPCGKEREGEVVMLLKSHSSPKIVYFSPV